MILCASVVQAPDCIKKVPGTIITRYSVQSGSSYSTDLEIYFHGCRLHSSNKMLPDCSRKDHSLQSGSESPTGCGAEKDFKRF